MSFRPLETHKTESKHELDAQICGGKNCKAYTNQSDWLHVDESCMLESTLSMRKPTNQSRKGKDWRLRMVDLNIDLQFLGDEKVFVDGLRGWG